MIRGDKKFLKKLSPLTFTFPVDPPLGVESGDIPDDQIYSSSFSGQYSRAAKARLNLQIAQGAWCTPSSKKVGEWLAVKLVTSHVISAVSHA